MQSFTRPVQSNSRSGNYGGSANSRKEGDVTVTKNSGHSDKKISDDEGEYVDYEDV